MSSPVAATADISSVDAPTITFPTTFMLSAVMVDGYEASDSQRPDTYIQATGVLRGIVETVLDLSSIDGPVSKETTQMVSTDVPGVDGQKGYEQCNLVRDSEDPSGIILVIDGETPIDDAASVRINQEIPLEFCMGTSIDDFLRGRAFIARIKESGVAKYLQGVVDHIGGTLAPAMATKYSSENEGTKCKVRIVKSSAAFETFSSTLDRLVVFGGMQSPSGNKCIHVHYTGLRFDISLETDVTIGEAE